MKSAKIAVFVNIAHIYL